MQTNPADHALALILVLGMPLYGAFAYRQFAAAVLRGEPGVRLREYLTTAGIEWALAAAAVVHWLSSARPLADLGFALPADGRSVVGLLAASVGLGFVAWQWTQVRRADEDTLRTLREQVRPVEPLMPRTDAEARGFRVLAVTAGVCEELLYRGFLIAYLSTAKDPWLAAAVGALVFGFAHFYQGVAGVAKTAVVGALAGALFVGSGSLLWPALLHAAVDLQGGAIGRLVLGSSPAVTASR